MRAVAKMMGKESVRERTEGTHLRALVVASIFWAVEFVVRNVSR